MHRKTRRLGAEPAPLDSSPRCTSAGSPSNSKGFGCAGVGRGTAAARLHRRRRPWRTLFRRAGPRRPDTRLHQAQGGRIVPAVVGTPWCSSREDFPSTHGGQGRTGATSVLPAPTASCGPRPPRTLHSLQLTLENERAPPGTPPGCAVRRDPAARGPRRDGPRAGGAPPLARNMFSVMLACWVRPDARADGGCTPTARGIVDETRRWLFHALWRGFSLPLSALGTAVSWPQILKQVDSARALPCPRSTAGLRSALPQRPWL